MSLKLFSFLKYYLVFTLFYGGINLYFGWDSSLKYFTPKILIMFRDFIWVIFIIFTIIIFIVKNSKIPFFDNYKITYTLLSIFALINILHIIHIPVMNILQHNYRNILMYSLIIPISSLFINKQNHLLTIQSIIIYSSLAIALIGIITYLMGPQYVWSGRILSTLFNPNTLGLFLNLSICFLYNKIFYFNKIFQIKYFFILLIVVSALLLTGSFQNYLFFFFINAYLIFQTFRYKNLKIKKSYIAILLFFVLSMVTVVFQNQNYFSGIFERFRNTFIYQTGTSISGRVLNYINIYEYIQTSDLLNLLFGDFSINRYHKYDSQYLNLLHNNGFIGLIIFFTLFFWISTKTKKVAKNWFYLNNIAIGAFYISIRIYLIGILFIAFNLTAYLNRFPINFILYLLVGLVFVGDSISKKLMLENKYPIMNILH